MHIFMEESHHPEEVTKLLQCSNNNEKMYIFVKVKIKL